MPIFSKPLPKIQELKRGIEEIEKKLAADRAQTDSVWRAQEYFLAAHQAVNKNPNRENVENLVNLAALRSANLEVVQVLANVEAQRREELRLSLRSLAHAAIDDVKSELKARLSHVEKEDAKRSEELGGSVVSHEIVGEIKRRTNALEQARACLDRGRMSEAVGFIGQASDAVL